MGKHVVNGFNLANGKDEDTILICFTSAEENVVVADLF